VLGGLITTGWNWRGIFLVNVPVGVVALAVTAWRVPEFRPPNPEPPDWPGFVLLTGGLVSLVYGLIRAGESSWSDGVVIGCLAAGVVLLASFVAAEARVAHPMFNLTLLRVPTFAGGSIAAFAMNGSLFALLLYFTIYLQEVLGYSALDAGLRIAVMSLAQLVMSVLAGRVSHRVPTRWLIGPACCLWARA
jgi:predicted MFS family arabinose efflux permease